ncbi:hypothetical protein CFN58_31290 [Pseudomonas avellanae]|uniref:KAP NTPase domain-containing protein n=2 Tax=Pseudomonas syringae group TaxID=136849 RepID=A0A261WB74_9PSED|nr:P-loop NTPase fold protein [Pseudomonas syringae]OZI83438.1 hypothetical protein CFN58_31290 [Pseudomonas avellanae]ATV19221.1 hypothetical protein CT122_22260 [Pseudomonas syringae pv. actinidiae]NYS39591.1 hypothetical protein [Pseudomonas syringae pv. actinidiae]PIN58255.1 hypothetical protein CUB86_28825 [Pseudomonas syringae pv. actinidiae]GAO97327.1 hypothetical protein PSA5_31430 [Pseudomonas syringae pv. actinidiae]
MNYVKKIKDTLRTFATEETNNSIVLKGAWGTGKTFLWDEIVRNNGKHFKNRNYSYVSLFGISTLKDLKRALFENKVFRDSAISKPSTHSLREGFKDIGGESSGWMRKGSSLLNDVSAFGFRGIGPAIEALQFLRVTDTLIVLDDFERKSSTLHDKEVLGLISLLCESKNCRVLMLLNDQNLSEEYTTYHEKVFDYEINYKPTTEDAASIVFKEQTYEHDSLKTNCIALEINNLRLLKKTQRYANVITSALKNAERKILDRAFLILPMAILAIYGGKNAKIDLDFILYGRHKPLPDSGDTDPVVREKWNEVQAKAQILTDYGITTIDDFDLSIIDLVRNGYLEQAKLDKLIERFEEKIEHEKHVYKLREAWNQYHKSFLDNEPSIVEAFSEAIRSGLHFFTVHELNSVADLYYELNRAGEIHPAIDQYVLDIIPKSDLEDENDIFHWPTNPYFSQRLKEHFSGANRPNTLTFEELIELALHSKNGMQTRSVLEGIYHKDDKDYTLYLESLDSYNLTKIVRMLLKCGQITTSNEITQDMYELVFIKTYRSLSELASRSQLNKSRMSKFQGFEKLYRSLEDQHKKRDAERDCSPDASPEH